MNIIDVSYEGNELDTERIKKILNTLCSYIKIDNVEFSVSFADEEEMHQLNKKYRNIDSSTDILSFVQSDKVEDDDFLGFWPEEQQKILGDMVICLDVMKINSNYFNVDQEEELLRLLIHGLLHLTGWDHKTNDSEEPMIIRQEQILKNIRSKF